jgi:Outer membrane protein beta-barrel domain
MQRFVIRGIGLVLFLLTTISIAKAQLRERWEVGGGLGVVGYLGDLNKNELLSREFNPSLNVFLRRALGEHLNVKANMLMGKLSGGDSHYETRLSRNLSMSAPLVEGSVVMEWDMNNMNPDFYRYAHGYNNAYTPYFFGGIGVAYTSSDVDFSETQTPYEFIKSGIAKDKAAQYSKYNVVFPVGVGFKYDLNPCSGLAVELAFRLSLTDYLDGVSYAGNPRRNDAYQMLTVKYMHRLGRYRCFPFMPRRR